LEKLGQNFAYMERGGPWTPKYFSNIFQKQFLVEILWKKRNKVWDEMRQISAQKDKYSVGK